MEEKRNEMEINTLITKMLKHLFRIDVVMLIALALIAALGVKDILNCTSTTKALSEVAQKVGVEFPTKTNNVFGVWQVVKPL